MKKNRNLNPTPDKFEKELLSSFQTDNWVSDNNIEETSKQFKNAISYTRSQKTKLSLTVNNSDLEQIENISLQFGLPANILIRSLIHNFATGKVVLKYENI